VEAGNRGGHWNGPGEGYWHLVQVGWGGGELAILGRIFL
jgi:hypothetical protein